MSQPSSKFVAPNHVPYSKPEFVRFSDNSGSGETFDGTKVRAYEYKAGKNGDAVRGFTTHWSTANRPEEEQVRLFHERDYISLHQANHHLSQCVKYLQAQAEYNLTVNKAPELSERQQELLAKYPHYYKDVRHLAVVDVYSIIALWEMTNGCQQHALKKVMLPGLRKKNDLRKDVSEARDTLNRWLEMMDEAPSADLEHPLFDSVNNPGVIDAISAHYSVPAQHTMSIPQFSLYGQRILVGQVDINETINWGRAGEGIICCKAYVCKIDEQFYGVCAINSPAGAKPSSPQDVWVRNMDTGDEFSIHYRDLIFFYGA